jgi:hypothetical protein
LETSRAHNDKWLAWLTEEIRKLGLEVTPSIANFVLIHFPEVKGRTAEDADAFLTKRGLILRRVKAYKLPNALRMSVGSEEANRLVVEALAEFVKGDRQGAEGSEDEGATAPSIAADGDSDVTAKPGAGGALISQLESRIAFLKSEARDEGGSYNEASESDFRQFVDSHASLSKPSLYLVDNGNLFLGAGQVQFVIFAKRPDATELVRSAGRDSLAGIERQIASFELGQLVYT